MSRVKEQADVAVDSNGIIVGVVPVEPDQEEKPQKFDVEELTTQSKQQKTVSQEEPKLPPPLSGAKTEKCSAKAQEAGFAQTVPKSDSNQVQTEPVDTVQDKPVLGTVSEKDCTKAAPSPAPAPEKNSLLKDLGKDSDSQLVVIGEQILPTPPADDQPCMLPSVPQPIMPPI